ncbi:hypothetical protein N1030_03310 [Desulfovibrio mangrovi]|uniref:hypothetical protein n=1 Tax=Desulfovibrio mangrovi TaxID=2976983 RepID=UPI002247487E|nr:hypothetical protein [Desulfovibrio mangrovi]UZP68018.1 hypothetical protein N1030_03310 [Desulfovibrio mangrovi]
MRHAIRLHYIVIALCIAIALTGCNAKRSTKNLPKAPTPTELRADPGYVQWLEKQAMLRSSQDLSRIVSNTNIQWLSPYVAPRPETLIKEAPVWLSLHPASVLTADNESLFKALLHPEFWRQTQKLGIRGLLLSPLRESGGIWGYDISGTQFLGADTVQYEFSKYAGTQDEYRRLTRAANMAGAVMGDTLLPAATGMGADFFLSARAKPEYLGIYSMIELPAESWPLLPEVPEQWQAEPISAEGLKALREQRILPPVRLRETLDIPFIPYGWAATGKVRGLDGTSRRYAYLYYGSPDRPVLNWTDPTAAARRIVSGSIIQQVGTLGVAFSGVSVAPYVGIEPATPAGRGDIAIATESARKAAATIAQEVRRYGGWSFLQDSLPLPMQGLLMQEGPDVAIDHAGSVSAQAALLTGDATILRKTLELTQSLGIDRKRLVHAIQPAEGVDLSLCHLYGTADTSIPPMREQYEKTMVKTITAAGGDILIKNGVLHSTPAGVVGMAAGIRDMQHMTAEQTDVMNKGMTALAAYHAMQPGIFMISGKEMAGTLPLRQGLVPARNEDEALRQNMMGAYDLLNSSRQTLITPLGMPKAQTVFGSIPEQSLTPYSFVWNLNRILQVREHYGIQTATPLAVLPTANTCSLVQLFRLPQKDAEDALLLVATNFGKETVTEKLSVKKAWGKLNSKSTALDLLVEDDSALPLSLEGRKVTLDIAPWQTRAILIGNELPLPPKNNY